MFAPPQRPEAACLRAFVLVGDLNFRSLREYGRALEEIAGALAQDTIAITGHEHGDMLALARQMQMDDLPHA